CRIPGADAGADSDIAGTACGTASCADVPSAATGDACAGPAPACPAPDRRRVRDDASMSGHNAAGAEFPQRFFLPACAPALEVCLLFSITAQRPDKFHRLAVSVDRKSDV